MPNPAWNLAIAAMILTTSHSQSVKTIRSKRSHFENFNRLLSIYKMNPLENSRIFKTFSKRVLLPSPKANTGAAMNINLKEIWNNKARTISTVKQKDIINNYEINQLNWIEAENEIEKNKKYRTNEFNSNSNNAASITDIEQFNVGSVDHIEFDANHHATSYEPVGNSTRVMTTTLNTNEPSVKQLENTNKEHSPKLSNIYNAYNYNNIFRNIANDIAAQQNIDHFHEEVVILRK